MSLLFSKIPQFFSPDPVGGAPSGKAPVENKSIGLEDAIEFLGADEEPPETLELDKTPPKGGKGKDETPPEGEEETSEGEEEPEEDELAEIEAELEGPPEDKLELVTPVRRKEILAKYPNLFKDFPMLENSYYRDQQFTEMFGTVKDAKVVAEKAETLDKFEGEIMGGSIANVLKAVKEENPDSFLKIVDGYMNTLAEVDERAYGHILGNIGRYTIKAMVKESRASNNKALESAAQILNQFLFGSSEFTQPFNLSRENPQEAQQNTQQTEREQAFIRQQFEVAHNSVNTRVNNVIRNTIESHIDPKGSMQEYVKKNAVKDAVETLASLMEKDTRFKGLTDKLWETVFKENFSDSSQERVRRAFLSRAKTLLPSVIKKARNDALRGTGHRVREMEEEKETPKGPVPSGKPRATSPGKIKNAKDIPAGMSTLDFLNSE
jgi:hypothetical protein